MLYFKAFLAFLNYKFLLCVAEIVGAKLFFKRADILYAPKVKLK